MKPWRDVAARMLGRPTPTRMVPTGSVRQQRRMPAPLRRREDRMLDYSPELDGRADPGEVVWTWVPYEEDPRQGKDRPVVVVGRRGRTMLGLMLSSNDRRDGQHGWLPVGTGSWDRSSRPSWVRLDRVLTVHETGIRREGSILDKGRFDRIAARLRSDYGWR